MTLEMIRSLILLIGWPILIIGSFIIIYKTHRFYIKTNKLALSKFILAQSAGILISMYSLGIVSTVFMYSNITTGIKTVLPVFLVWFITMTAIFYISEKWKDEAVKINILYYRLKERSEKLKQEKNKLTHIAQNMDTGAILLDNKGAPMFINREAKDIIGSKTDDERELIKLIYKKFSKIRLRQHVNNCIKGNPSNITSAVIGDKIYDIYLRCLIEHRENNKEFFGHFIWIRDITDEKTLDEAKSRFITVVSHKLRTPLTIIKGAIDLMARNEKDEKNHEKKQYMNMIKQVTEKTINLINKIISTSETSISKQKIYLKKINILSIIKKAISELDKTIKNGKCDISLKIDEKAGLFISSDSNLLKKAIKAIIENAVIYSNNAGAGQHKKIAVKVYKKDDNIIISIKDNGIGIPKNDTKKIFSKFFRSENALKVHTEGIGLNLYLADTIINSLAGRLWFETKINKGSEFFISLPCRLYKKIKTKKTQ